MRIAHVITGLSDGGAEGVLYRLCVSDLENSHSVISLTDRGKYGDLLTAADIEVVCLGTTGVLSALGSLFKLCSLLRERRPDVVHTWMYHADFLGGIAARLAGLGAIVWGIRQSNLRLGQSKLSTIILTRVLSLLSYVVPRRVVCCATAAMEVHAAIGYQRRKLEVLHNGIDTERFIPNGQKRDEVRTELRIDPQVVALGMVARFDRQKDHRGFLRALGEVAANGYAFTCVLAGQGVDRDNDALMGWLAEFGLEERVVLVGQEYDIAELMNALDLHILSSAYGEGFPNVVGEAMACGVPCIATTVGDAAVIIGDTGWVVPPSDPDSLAASLRMILTDASGSLRYAGQAARDRITTEFSLEKMVEAHRLLYRDLAGR